MSPVGAFVEANVRPEFRDVAEAIRALMREAAPAATERMRYGLPMWTGAGHIAYLSPNRQGITFGFPYGASFSDPHGMLRGRGKHARHVRITDRVDPAVLRSYIEQALAHDDGTYAGTVSGPGGARSSAG